MKAYRVAYCLGLFILGACGADTQPAAAKAPASLNVALKGTVQAFPIPATESLPAFTNMRLRIYDANAIWSDSRGAGALASSSLYDATVPSARSSCASSGCTFFNSSQNIIGAGPDLVALVSGSGAASQQQWAPTYTNFVNAASLLQAQQHRGVLYANAPAYAISLYALEQLAAQLGLADAKTLLARGLIIGMVRGRDPADFSGGLPEAVGGASVTLTSQQAVAVSLHYPNDNYTNAQLAASTNADGVFYLLGTGAAATLAATPLHITAANSSYVWTDKCVALIGGSVVVAPLSAQP